MLVGQIFNPAVPGIDSPLVQIPGAILFCAVFLFLWRQSGVRYFGFWSLAWAMESAGIALSRGPLVWFRVLFEFLFALSLLTAARSASVTTTRGLRSSLSSMWLLGLLLLTVYVIAVGVPVEFPAFHSAALAIIYGYSTYSIGLRSSLNKGAGGRMLRFSLALLFLQYLGDVQLHWLSTFDMVPQLLLALSAMAMWIQTQQDGITQLRSDIVTLEKTAAGSAELDHLTGLQNRMALDRYLAEPFTGVVAVCDLDYFKDINDRFGHLVGDEVLRSVGHLIRQSIRAEDAAFRWGGDEFVIVFRHQHLELALGRMTVLEDRLRTFRIRGHGVIPLGLSWGAAEGEHRELRPVLEEADHQMYERKRQTHARKG
jgi:diguanylate cyclase (GGDEF)-like protein